MSGFESASRYETNSEMSWKVKEPDEAKYNFSDQKGVWQPNPEDILSMFEKLANGNPLPIKWTCPGRRPPDRNANSEKNTLDGVDMEGDDSKEEELKAPEISAFDFDEPHIDVNSKLIPKRTPGGLGRTPKTEKRVARMDNIMKSLHKQQLQRAAEREARKTKGSPSTTPGRSRLLFFGTDKHSATGFQATVASSPRFAGGSSASNTSPLLNRSSTFMTPNASARKMTPTTPARKMTPKSATNSVGVKMTATDSRVSESGGLYSNTFTSSKQGSTFDFPEGRSEQTRDLSESSTCDLPPSSTATYSPSPAFNNSVTTNSTKVNTSSSFMPSIISTALSVTSNMISSSAPMSTVKESLITTPDSNQQFVSISSRTAVSTVTSILTTNLITNTITSETHSSPSTVTSTAQAGGSHISSGVNIENVVSEASSHDPPSNLTESVSLANLSVSSDAHNFGNASWKPPSSS